MTSTQAIAANTDGSSARPGYYNYSGFWFDLSKGEDGYVPNFVNFLTNCEDASYFCLKSGGGTAFAAFVIPKSCQLAQRGGPWHLNGLTTRAVASFRDRKTGKRVQMLQTLEAPHGAYLYAREEGIIAILFEPSMNVASEAMKDFSTISARGIIRLDTSDPKQTLARCQRP